MVTREALDMGQFGHAHGASPLPGDSSELCDRRVHVPDRQDGLGDEPPRVGTAPVVDVPVVVGLQHDEGQVFVLRLLERATAEAGHAGETHGRQHSVPVHVTYPLVDVVGAGTHLGMSGRVESPLLLRPGHHRVEPDHRHLLVLVDPLVLALFVVHDVRGLVHVAGRQVSLEHVRRLNDVIVDADQDHVVRVHGVLLTLVSRAPCRRRDQPPRPATGLPRLRLTAHPTS